MGRETKRLLKTSPTLFHGNIPTRLYYYDAGVFGLAVQSTVQPLGDPLPS